MLIVTNLVALPPKLLVALTVQSPAAWPVKAVAPVAAFTVQVVGVLDE